MRIAPNRENLTILNSEQNHLVSWSHFLPQNSCRFFTEQALQNKDVHYLRPINSDEYKVKTYFLPKEMPALAHIYLHLKHLAFLYYNHRTHGILRAYVNFSDPHNPCNPHQDFQGELNCFSAVIFLKSCLEENRPLTFYGKNQDITLEVPNHPGKLVIFPSQLWHSQGQGRDRASLVINFQ